MPYKDKGICPHCGGEMYIKSTQCRKCAYERGPQLTTTCPECGGTKHLQAKRCFDCHWKPRFSIVDNGDGTASIHLTGGHVAIIDSVDIDLVSPYRWTTAHKRSGIYVRSTDSPAILLHRLILGFPDAPQIDHIDTDTLNNRRGNLRPATYAQNQMNRRLKAGGTSQFKGVSWSKKSQCWVAMIRISGRQIYLGQFCDEVDAARTYDANAQKHFGAYALLNFPDEVTD